MPNPILENLNKNKRPNMFDNLMQTNPQFREFVQKNQGKTPEQIAKDYGIDPNLLKKFIR